MRNNFTFLSASRNTLLGFITVSTVALGPLSGCSRHPDLVGIYSLPSSLSDGQWSMESVLELRDDGSAVVQGITFHSPDGSELSSEVVMSGEGKWWVEENKVIYEGAIETDLTLGDMDHQGSEPMRIVFTMGSNGDLLLLSRDAESDSVRYVKER